MALDRYRRKRDFDETPEPGPKVKRSPSGDLFVVQKHAATRLHYDLRLEMDGVLKSWAVPKGPSLDPAEKRLAVHVEDHPLDYAGFEGTIPEGEYGGGTVLVWDTGRWHPDRESAVDPEKSYREGRLKFRLEGEKLRGGWVLVRLRGRPGEEDKENWLLFKERDDEARQGAEAAITARAPNSVLTGRTIDEIAVGAGGARDPLGGAPDPARVEGARKGAPPERLEPELATLVAEAPMGDDWIHEIKLDGYRIMSRLEDGAARLSTRRGADWSSHFPTLLPEVRRVPARQAVLDGEVVYVEDDGRTSFPKLAGALQSGTDPEGRIVYYVFDLLYLDGCDLTRAPLHARKDTLRRLLASLGPASRVRYVDHLRGHGEEFFRQTCALSLEGSVAKRRGSPYRPGRGRDWLKIKCTRRREFVIGGFTERSDAEDRVGALLLGFHEGTGGPLRYAGRVGTGWDARAMRELRARLDELVQAESPYEEGPRGRDSKGVNWVKPDLVAEVEYLSWSDKGLLRHPSFEGLRLDKPAADVVGEDPAPAGRQPSRPAAEKPRPTPPRRGRREVEPVVVAGVAISHPDRVVYPDLGLTKLDVARYYEAIAPRMLPYLRRRPLTLVRCPGGYAEECFFQKHAVGQFPDSVLHVEIDEGAGGMVDYVAVDSTAGLLSLVQMGVMEFHPWGSRMGSVERPDEIVFDFDPDPALPFARVIEGARLMHDLLEGLGLASFVKTTGGKGLHVVAPVEPTREWHEVKAFTKACAESLAMLDPSRYVVTMSLKKRVGRIYVDYLRNGRGSSSIAAYSTRRRPGAPVSTPLRWDELRPGLRADAYTLRNVRRRLARLDRDPWEGYDDVKQRVGDEMLRIAGLAPHGE